MAFLRQARLIADQAGHDFEASGDFLHEFQGKVDEFGEHAAEADAHDQGAFPRLNMDIARASADRVEQDAIDEMADLDALFGRLGLKVLNRMVHND